MIEHTNVMVFCLDKCDVTHTSIDLNRRQLIHIINSAYVRERNDAFLCVLMFIVYFLNIQRDKAFHKMSRLIKQKHFFCSGIFINSYFLVDHPYYMN